MRSSQRVVIALFACLVVGLAWQDRVSWQYPSTQNDTAEKAATNKSNKKGFWETTATDPVAAFTLGIVVVGLFQAGLFFIQLRFIRESLSDAEKGVKAAQDAAKAAADNAKALVSAERARFHIVINSHNLDKFIRAAIFYPNSGGMQMSGDAEINYFFKNYGKAPGLILEMSHDIALSEHPPDPVYQVIRQVPREYMVPGGQETEHQICTRGLPVLSVADALEVENGRKTVWFCGRFDYRDFVTNEPQVHRFYLRYIRTESGIWRFQSIEHKHYNQST